MRSNKSPRSGYGVAFSLKLSADGYFNNEAKRRMKS